MCGGRQIFFKHEGRSAMTADQRQSKGCMLAGRPKLPATPTDSSHIMLVAAVFRLYYLCICNCVFEKMYLRNSARLKLPSHSNHSKSYQVDPYLMCTLISHPYTNNVYSDWSSRRTNQILPLESISNQPRANNSPLTKSFSPDVTDRGFRFQRATKT